MRDVDTSAISSLDQVQNEYRERGVKVYLTGIALPVRERVDRFGFAKKQVDGSGLHIMTHLDDALQHIEEDLLSARSEQAQTEHADTFLEQLAAQVPEIDLSETFDTVSLCDGETLVEEGASSNEVFVLLEGKAAAIVGVDTDKPLVAARFEPGALIGEMAFYRKAPRRATVKAEGSARFMRIDARDIGSSGRLSKPLLMAFHELVSTHLAQRLDRMTKLLHDARV